MVRFIAGPFLSAFRKGAKDIGDPSGPGVARERNFPMTTLKVGIASYKDMKARTMGVARGEQRVAPGEPKVGSPRRNPSPRFCRQATATCCG
jgi:hypothetical protein